jgi:hypothetical protein
MKKMATSSPEATAYRDSAASAALMAAVSATVAP